jgi:hypothetical protein
MRWWKEIILTLLGTELRSSITQPSHWLSYPVPQVRGKKGNNTLPLVLWELITKSHASFSSSDNGFTTECSAHDITANTVSFASYQFNVIDTMTCHWVMLFAITMQSAFRVEYLSPLESSLHCGLHISRRYSRLHYGSNDGHHYWIESAFRVAYRWTFSSTFYVSCRVLLLVEVYSLGNQLRVPQAVKQYSLYVTGPTSSYSLIFVICGNNVRCFPQFYQYDSRIIIWIKWGLW